MTVYKFCVPRRSNPLPTTLYSGPAFKALPDAATKAEARARMDASFSKRNAPQKVKSIGRLDPFAILNDRWPSNAI